MSRETKAKAEQLRDFNSQVNSLVATGVKSLGATVQELYSATQYLLNELALYQSPSYLNLTAKLNATTPATQVDVAWEGLRIGNRYTEDKSFTLDITQSGALGLDTGSAANSTWYYIYAICNDAGSVVSAVMSASSTAPTLPSGYKKYRWISAVYRKSDGTFLNYNQLNQYYSYSNEIVILSVGRASTYTTIDLSAYVPINVIRLMLSGNGYALAAGSSWAHVGFGVKGSINGCYCEQFNNITQTSIHAAGASSGHRDTFPIITDSRAIQYLATDSGGWGMSYVDMFIYGFEVLL